MSWLSLVVLGAAGLGSMRAAVERGDVDEATRQGVLAGAGVVEQALRAPDRATRLAGIAAAPRVEGRAELLDALATAAAGPDRRTALPAARAARAIARELAARGLPEGLPDDLASDDVLRWRDAWATLARRGDRWIDLRVVALDTAAALDPGGTGVDLGAALSDPDPALRRAALAVVPAPTPARMRGALAGAVISDTDPGVALAAAATLCADLPADPAGPLLDALGGAGLTRLRVLVTTDGAPRADVREAARCLAADGSPASTAALRAIRGALR